MRRGPSGGILTFCRSTPFRKELAHQIETVELATDSSAKLRSGQKHKAMGGFQEHKRRPRTETGPSADIRRHHDTSTVSHYDSVCPTH